MLIVCQPHHPVVKDANNQEQYHYIAILTMSQLQVGDSKGKPSIAPMQAKVAREEVYPINSNWGV